MLTDNSDVDPMTSDDLTARESRWGSLISMLEDECDDDSDDSNENMMLAPGLSSSSNSKRIGMGVGMSSLTGGGRRASSWVADSGTASSSLASATRVTPSLSNTKQSPPFPRWSGGSGVAGQVSLNDWIILHRGDGGIDSGECKSLTMDISERRKYLEKSVYVLHSLVGKIVGFNSNNSNGSNGEGKIMVHPNFITVANVIVSETATIVPEDVGKISADFVQSGDSIFFNGSGEDETKKKYLAMDALGRMAYEMIMLGDGPSVYNFFSPSKPATEASLSNAMSIHNDQETTEEDEIISMLRKNPRTTTSEEMDKSGLISTMLNASVPFPLCRFVSDLLDDEHGSMFRSEHAFSSFKDILSDLTQMMENPEGILHASSPDRWKLVLGEKLYGRDGDTKAFLDAADRVFSIRDDPLFNSLSALMGKRREVVMVSGHTGAGKSRLVRSGGAFLEKRGWRFLRCKFDRLVHPEPLSILAYAFDEYFGSFASCPKHGMTKSYALSDLECRCPRGSQEIRHRLKRIICPDGLGILAKHIPSLHLVLDDIQSPSSSIEVNQTMMASLFGKLLQVLSSERTPILFFLDDLQWADPLSLALLTSLVKGAGPDLLHLSSASENTQIGDQIVDPEGDEIHVMFVGSYRDNEVDDDHPLAKVIRKFELDRSTNVTNIALSRFTIETLNEMLSESLCVPVRRVRSLSELVIQKTDGQPLHVIEFIQALTMDNLLTHSFARGWEWDADSIEICPITDSVAELFAYKLRRLPKDILLGLQILSCFGSQIDQHLLSFVADYDGENSADITAAITVAVSKGLIEQAAQLVSFSHDVIQKATIDSIHQNDIIPLLRKLASALIKNASAVGELDSILFVAVDLINRIGSNATPHLKERALFAELNLRAASKAITVPDFDGGAKYSENGISFLSDDHWESQYDLSLHLYETAVLSHFSSLLEGKRDKLMKRIDTVFDHAKDFSDQFKTHCVWLKILAMTNLSRAIEESLIALDRLGEPLDLTDIDYKRVCDELVKRKLQFSGEMKKKFLSTSHIDDTNKVRAMKIMALLMVYYHQAKSSLGAFISCQMMEMSMKYGHCAESVFGAAAFASALVNLLEDVDEGSAWGRTTLSLIKRYDEDVLVPSVHAALYGIVFVWKEPIQSTLEPLARGIHLSFATGNVEFTMANIIFYIGRSFNCGKNIRVLTGEVEALARQHGNHFGNDASSDASVYSPLLQFFLTPMYNVLHDIEGGIDFPKEKEPTFPSDKVRFVNNGDIMKVALEEEKFSCFHMTLSYETTKAFILRDMDNALKYADMYHEHFLTKTEQMKFTEIFPMFYEALITFFFMRQTGEERYRVRGRNALMKMREWSVHSDWNFKNKVLLIEAEMHYAKGDFDKAVVKYKASVKAAQEHKLIHEEALASELAGNFFLERGQRQKSHSYFKHASECYEKWGAFVISRRIEDVIRNEFVDSGSMQSIPTSDLPKSIIAVVETSKKRPLND